MPLSEAITTNLTSTAAKKQIAVIGAGVVGLSAALTLLERGYDVTILAEHWPTDGKSIHYTSTWAGAHHISDAGDDKDQSSMDQETFEKMWKMSEPGLNTEHCFMRVQQTEFYGRKDWRKLDSMPNYRVIPKDELIPGAHSGVSFHTVTIDTPVYLRYLYHTFLAQGGKIMRVSLQHISQTIAYIPSTDLIVVCAGLGARSLGGVEDRTVYPIRGQTVLLRAPWVRYGVSLAEADVGTYIIPRRSGDVIIGGTKTPNDWTPTPSKDTVNAILGRAAKLCPQLAGPDRTECTLGDLQKLVIGENCGLRPAREGSIRLDSTTMSIGGKDVGVVYNYGHGGYGYQSSWGSARLAADLVEKALLTCKN